MEPTTNVKQDQSELMGICNLVLAVLVTIIACITILPRWGTYGWLDKSLCLILLLNLAMRPILTLRSKKRWDERLKLASASDSYLGYTWVLLLLFLFKVA